MVYFLCMRFHVIASGEILDMFHPITLAPIRSRTTRAASRLSNFTVGVLNIILAVTNYGVVSMRSALYL